MVRSPFVLNVQERRESRGQGTGKGSLTADRSEPSPVADADAAEDGKTTALDDACAAAAERSASPAGRSEKAHGKRRGPGKGKGKGKDEDARAGGGSPCGGGGDRTGAAEGAHGGRGRTPSSAGAPGKKKEKKGGKQPRLAEKAEVEEEETGVANDGLGDDLSPSLSPPPAGKDKGKSGKNRTRLRRLVVESDRVSVDGSVERSPGDPAVAEQEEKMKKKKKKKKSGKRKAEEAMEHDWEQDDKAEEHRTVMKGFYFVYL